MHRSALRLVIREVVRRNRVRDGLVYLQVTRGVAPRDHAFPPADTPPALVITAKSVPTEKGDRMAAEGIGVITLPDNRWARVDIKSVSLLPNALAKAEGEGSRRTRGVVRRQRRLCDGRLLDHRLDRDQGRRARDPPERHRHPAWHHAGDHDRGGAPGRASRRGAEIHRGGGKGGARGLHHGGDAPSSCRSSGSTARRSQTATPAALRRASGSVP